MASTKKYDFLIVGAGLYGAVFAHEAKKRGKTCLVVDKREHIGGNTFCKKIEDINVHAYGAHIFHTNDKKICKYFFHDKLQGFFLWKWSECGSVFCGAYISTWRQL